MIKAMHALIYSDDAQATRAFLREVLQWPSVQSEEIGPDWPIYRSGPSEVGVHPTTSEWEGQVHTSPRHHSISLMCDGLDSTMKELRERGAEFRGEPQDMGFGVGAMLVVPGADDILLYEPRHAEAHGL